MVKYKTVDPLEPTILVIFGASGELTSERLVPALFHLFNHGLLPRGFKLVGFSRRAFSHQEFRKRLAIRHRNWEKFARSISYHPGNFTDPADFRSLAQYLHEMEGRGHTCANRLFYFATLPTHYDTISEELKKSGLLIGCGRHKRETRVLLEKPFGFDLRSANRLDQTLNKYFREEQIYRIDHYLAKETVQNIFAMRFGNTIFEPLWNRLYVDHVQISALEDVGVNERGAYFERVGTISDMFQSHLLQLLAIIAMEPPRDLTTASIRAARGNVIKEIRKPATKELIGNLVIGQYRGYHKEPNITAGSAVETYAALKLFIDSERWEEIPFYLRSGKRMGKKTTTVSVHFKPNATPLFEKAGLRGNTLIFQIQPDEGVYLEIMAKYPGFGIRLHPIRLKFGYGDFMAPQIPDAHERLLLDFMQGDQRLFAATEEIEAAWEYIDVLKKYARGKKPTIYEPGGEGPKEAEKLIQKDDRQWLKI